MIHNLSTGKSCQRLCHNSKQWGRKKSFKSQVGTTNIEPKVESFPLQDWSQDVHTPSSKSKQRVFSDLQLSSKNVVEDTNTLEKIKKYLANSMVKISNNNRKYIGNHEHSHGNKLWLYTVYRTASACSIIYKFLLGNS